MPCTWKKGGRVGREGREGWGPDGRGQPLAIERIKNSRRAREIFLRFFFPFFLCEQLGVIQECLHTRRCVRGTASITWRRQRVCRERRTSTLSAHSGKKGWFEEVDGGGGAASLSRLDVQLGMCLRYRGPMS